MIFIEYPKCSTCRKAKEFLENNNIDFQDRNIVIENPAKKELIKWIDMSGKDINGFFNTSGLKYRELHLKDKIKTMTKEEKIDLLSSDGMLVKRPILVLDNVVLIGFKKEEWERVLE